MIAGCRAGCSCHGIGQILGRSIRLGVIHHLRTTHGSGASGGPGVAAAALCAGAGGATATVAAAAVRVAAPAATAAKAGPRRPRAPRRERAREGLAISGGPCAGTFIFSPSGCPLRSRLYSDGTTLQPAPRQEHDSAGLRLGWQHPQLQHSARRHAQPPPGPRSSCPGSRAMLCIHTMHARDSSYRQRGRLGEDREAGAGEPEWGGVGSYPPQLAGAVYLKSSTNSGPQRAGRPAGGPWGGRLPIGAKFAALSASRRAMLVGGDWYARGSAPSKLRRSPPSLGHLAASSECQSLSQGASTPMMLEPDQRKAKCKEGYKTS